MVDARELTDNHGYSGRMVPVIFTKPFIFTHPDNVRQTFPAGSYEVPAEVADHWFAKAHSDQAEFVAPAPGTPDYADFARKNQQADADRSFKQQRIEAEQSRLASRKAMEDEMRPRIAEELRTSIEAEVRASLEAEMKSREAATRAAIETEVRAKIASETPPAKPVEDAGKDKTKK